MESRSNYLGGPPIRYLRCLWDLVWGELTEVASPVGIRARRARSRKRRWALRSAEALALNLCVFAPLLSIVACSGHSAHSNETSHPTTENIPQRSASLGRIDRIDSVGSSSGLRAMASGLLKARQIASFGDGRVRFGSIQGIAVSSRGDIYILDGRFNRVVVFREDGSVESTFGAPGFGPFEFQAPTAIDVDARQELIVVDRYKQIKVFTKNDSSFQHRKTLSVDFVPEGVCHLGDRLYVRGWLPSGLIIHQFEPDNRYVRSFGAGYKSDVPLVRQQLSRGLIACSSGAGVVVVSFGYFPFLYAYSPDGQLLWVSQIADFHPAEILSTVGPPAAITYKKGAGYDTIVSLVPIGSRFIIAQVARRYELDPGTERRDFRTYLISAEDGKGLYLGDALPPIVAAQLPRIYAVKYAPSPEVLILSVDSGEAQ